jgi:hypothetical protein
MIDLDDALGSLVGVAARYDEPVETIMARARRRVVRRRTVRAVCVVVVVTVGVGAALLNIRSHSRPSVSVQPSTGVISRADAIAAVRALDAHLAPSWVLSAKLVSFDDYVYASNGGSAPTAPVRPQPTETPIGTTTPIWLIYVQGANTIALGHGPPATWALVFVDGSTGKIAYRVSDTNPDWPYWALLPDRAGPGDRAAFCAVARQTLHDNNNVPDLTPQEQFQRSTLQVEHLLAVAPPRPRDDLTTMRTYLKAEINNARPQISYRDEGAATVDFDNAVRNDCGIDLGTESILGFNSHKSSSGTSKLTP